MAFPPVAASLLHRRPLGAPRPGVHTRVVSFTTVTWFPWCQSTCVAVFPFKAELITPSPREERLYFLRRETRPRCGTLWPMTARADVLASPPAGSPRSPGALALASLFLGHRRWLRDQPALRRDVWSRAETLSCQTCCSSLSPSFRPPAQHAVMLWETLIQSARGRESRPRNQTSQVQVTALPLRRCTHFLCLDFLRGECEAFLATAPGGVHLLTHTRK